MSAICYGPIQKLDKMYLLGYNKQMYTVKETKIFSKKREEVVLLLVGGDKSTQLKDIEKAKIIAKELQDE